VGMLLFGLLCLGICYWIEVGTSAPLWLVSIILFVLAWIGQFYGHKVEGKKPSFFKRPPIFNDRPYVAYEFYL